MVLQDIRKAYDTIGWEALEKAFSRIKMNTVYCDILRDLHNNRRSSVITAHGLTEPHIVQDGLDQGETHAPILWRIFYDPLLCAVNNINSQTGYHMSPVPTLDTPQINHLAFVDDTVWISNSHQGMNRILEVAYSFFLRNDIQINIAKTETLLVLGKKAQKSRSSISSSLSFCDNTISVSNPNIAHRYLGIWISGDNKPEHTFWKLKTEINHICCSLDHKPITDKTASYIIQTVALPIIEYRTKGLYISPALCNKLNSNLKSMFRKKANLSKSTACKTIHHPDFYGIPTVSDIQLHARVTKLIYDLNSPRIEGQFTRHRLAQFQYSRWTRTNPLAAPIPINRRNPFKLLVGVNNDLCCFDCAIFDAESNFWKRPTPQRGFLQERTTIQDALGPFLNFQAMTNTLRKANLLYLDQISGDRGSIKPLSVIRLAAGLNPRGRSPLWYSLLRQRLNTTGSINIQLPAARNQHALKWKPSTNIIQEIVSINACEEYFNRIGNLHLEVDPPNVPVWNTHREKINNADFPILNFYTDGSLKKTRPDSNCEIRIGED